MYLFITDCVRERVASLKQGETWINHGKVAIDRMSNPNTT